MARARLAVRSATAEQSVTRKPPAGPKRLVAQRLDEHTDALWTGFRAAHTAEGMPIDDLAEAGRLCYAYWTDRATLAAFGGLQVLGEHALFRSIEVLPGHRGCGLAAQIVSHLLDCARESGARHAWLLTEDAQSLFASLGFQPVAPDQAPAELASAPHFRLLCARDAQLMTAAV